MNVLLAQSIYMLGVKMGCCHLTFFFLFFKKKPSHFPVDWIY